MNARPDGELEPGLLTTFYRVLGPGPRAIDPWGTRSARFRFENIEEPVPVAACIPTRGAGGTNLLSSESDYLLVR
jgi:hypothetical protein